MKKNLSRFVVSVLWFVLCLSGYLSNQIPASAQSEYIPLPPTQVTATTTSSGIRLNWKGSFGATKYFIYRSATSGQNYTHILTYNSNGADYHTITDSIPLNNRNFYLIRANNYFGTSANSNEASAYGLLSAPTGLVATPDDRKVDLSWTPVPGATKYKVQRSTSATSGFDTKAEPTTNSWTNTGLENGRTYYFRVAAVNAFGTSGWSDVKSAVPGIYPPAKPLNVTAQPLDKQIQVTWDSVPNAQYYEVWFWYYGIPWTLRESNCTSTGYLAQALINGRQYGFLIRSVRNGLVSDWSDAAYATPNLPNRTPVANNDSYSINEDTTLNIAASGVLANDTDADGNTLTAIKVSNPSKGTVTLNGNGSFVYTPNLNANGPDSFTYKANDGTADSNIATVNINIVAVNDTPTANPQSITPLEDTPKAITLTANDPEGASLTYSVTTSPSKGTLSGSAPNLTYTPNLNAMGADSFSFAASDGNTSGGATITISITPVNDEPVANDQPNVSTNEDTAKTIVLSATDVDGNPLTYVIESGPSNGTLSGTGNTRTYTPNLNWNGTDTFTFKAVDNSGQPNNTSNIATVIINVTPVNDKPVANAQSVTTDEDTATTITLTGSDIEGSALSYTVVSTPTKGTLSGTAPNLTYTPSLNKNGPDSFTFKTNDGALDSTTATVSINIRPINDNLVAVNDSASTPQDTPIDINVKTNDTDVDADILAVSQVTQGSQGTVTINANGTVKYSPNSGATGSDSFTYTISDGNGGSATATVNITITIGAPAQPPVPDIRNIGSTSLEVLTPDPLPTNATSLTLQRKLASEASYNSANDLPNLQANTTVNVNSLLPSTEYSFRYIAVGPGGTTIGNPATITTAAPAPELQSLTLNPTSVIGGGGRTSTGTITLTQAAPAGGIVVNLQSSNINVATVATSVTVPANETSYPFTVNTSVVTDQEEATISATFDTVTMDANLTIKPDPNTVPSNLMAVSTGSGKITLYWQGLANASGYNVYRGLASGEENYLTPINGLTPITLLSYAGSDSFMFTDTNLANGVEYFYTVKAIVNGVESGVSNEDSDIVDPEAIPWDTKNPSQILSMAANLANSATSDEPIEPTDHFVIMGPDGAVYERGKSAQQPASGRFTEDGLFVTSDGDSIVPPNVEQEDNTIQLMEIGGKLRGGPYRGAYTNGGYREEAFSVHLGPVNITNNTVVEDGVRKSINETAYVIMGSRTVNGSAAVDAALGNGNFRRDGKWHPFVRVFADGEPSLQYPDARRGVRAYYGKNVSFEPGTDVKMHYWVDTNKPYGRSKKVLGFIRYVDVADSEVPAVAIGFPLSDHNSASKIGMKRAQQLAQSPENFGSRFYHRTGSSMRDFIWWAGRLRGDGEAQLREWKTRDLKTGLRYGNPCSVPGDVVSARVMISPSWEQDVNIVLPYP